MLFPTNLVYAENAFSGREGLGRFVNQDRIILMFDRSNQIGSSFLVPQGPFQGLIRVKTSLQSEPSTTISSQSD
jgi:hypothetical protein